jgi:hypothetical protein
MNSTGPTMRPGSQLASTVCGTRVIVVRAPAGEAPQIACAGSPMVPADGAGKPTSPAAAAGDATLLGKRYVNADGTLELLCTSPGSGPLTCDGEPMTVKAAKPLPASD